MSDNKVNFYVTSAMSIHIRSMDCSECDEVIYYLDDYEPEECVHCGCDLYPSIMDWISDCHYLIVDPKTGALSIVEVDENNNVIED